MAKRKKHLTLARAHRKVELPFEQRSLAEMWDEAWKKGPWPRWAWFRPEGEDLWCFYRVDGPGKVQLVRRAESPDNV